MAREGEKRSHIRKRKKGCLTGCLTNILLVLGVAAAIFVGAHVLGFVKTDSTTGAPIISFDHIGLENLPEIKLDGIKLTITKEPHYHLEGGHSKLDLMDLDDLTEFANMMALRTTPDC